MIDKEPLKLTLSLLKEEEQFGHKFTNKLIAIDLKLSFNKPHFKEDVPDIGAFLHFISNNYFDIITITMKLEWQKNCG